MTYKLAIRVNYRKSDTELLRSAVEFYMAELLRGRDFSGTIHIEVKFTPKFSKLAGIVEVQYKKNVKWFVITIGNDSNFLDILSTLGHECVHIQQHVLKKLSGYKNWVWEGINYGLNPYTMTEADDILPWEAEAYAAEVALVKKFLHNYYQSW
jgi:hypothetical protein